MVDALPARAFGRRHLPGALNLVIEEVDAQAAAVLPDPQAPVVVYSTDEDCERAADLAAALEQRGYTSLRLFPAGIEGWVAAGLPVEGRERLITDQ